MFSLLLPLLLAFSTHLSFSLSLSDYSDSQLMSLRLLLTDYINFCHCSKFLPCSVRALFNSEKKKR